MRIGVVLPRDLPDDQTIAFGRTVDSLGFDDLWVVEDLGFKGGFSQAAAILASTDKVHVGVGILPVAARNPVFTAMEAATLAATFPRRLTLGLGHGMPSWMRQVGAHVESPLTLLAETLEVIGRLLAGERVSFAGRYIHLDNVRLESPPPVRPPVFAGVRGPRSLAVSGEHADGTLLAEPVTVPYLHAARALTEPGVERRNEGSSRTHALYAYNLAYVADDRETARQEVRQAVGVFGQPDWWPHIAPSPFAAEFRELAERLPDPDQFAQALPGEWIDELALVGTPESVGERLAELSHAGAAGCSFFVKPRVTGDQLLRLSLAARDLR